MGHRTQRLPLAVRPHDSWDLCNAASQGCGDDVRAVGRRHPHTSRQGDRRNRHETHSSANASSTASTPTHRRSIHAFSVGGSRFDRSRFSVRCVIAVLSRLGTTLALSADFCCSGNALRLLGGSLQTRRRSVSRRDRPRIGEANPVCGRAGPDRCVGRNASSLRLHDICQQPDRPRAVAPVEVDCMEAATPRNRGAQDPHHWRRSNRSLHRPGTAQ